MPTDQAGQPSIKINYIIAKLFTDILLQIYKKAHCKKKDICQRSVNICFCTVHTCSCKFASIIRKIYALCRFSYKVSFNSTFAYFIFLVKFMHIMRFEEAGNKFSAKY